MQPNLIWAAVNKYWRPISKKDLFLMSDIEAFTIIFSFIPKEVRETMIDVKEVFSGSSSRM